MSLELTRESWITELQQIFIDGGMEPKLSMSAANKYLSKLESYEHRLIYGDPNMPEPIGLLNAMGK